MFDPDHRRTERGSGIDRAQQPVARRAAIGGKIGVDREQAVNRRHTHPVPIERGARCRTIVELAADQHRAGDADRAFGSISADGFYRT